MTAYNAGTIALSRGELREAEFLLQTAKGLSIIVMACNKSPIDIFLRPLCFHGRAHRFRKRR